MSLFAVDKLGTIPALSLAMVIGVGVLATPSYRQRIYSGKDVSSVRRSFVYTGVLYLFFLGAAGGYRHGGLDDEPQS